MSEKVESKSVAEGAQSAAPASAPKVKRSQGQSVCAPSEMSEKVKSAPVTKPSASLYGGAYKADEPSRAPASMSLPSDSSKMELDGHKLKAKK